MAKPLNGTMKSLAKDRLDITQNQANQLISEEMALGDLRLAPKNSRRPW
ncbi:TPA: hypothetical protein ACK8Z3_000193 [Legionella pneumophila]|nr:hypothetical protein [Legionella pneumophila]ERH46253.1 hypothetical protein N751_08330 [Legionella pneumophila str. Leg01/11]ERH46707.1 hypothetical protein N750_17695 [Legionella pneumophila str. Leg01/53]ERI47625.1 hypothetical protein N749_13205 [Legionella pneumophila str. Leg01/20]ERB40355.1 hypothetical protein N748_15610 [Legionella pneumophila str. 121004]MCW8392770.1 hypothetical protein [Legionella pneumophila]